MATHPAQSELLSTAELMQLLKIKHKQTVYKLVKEGMPFSLDGRNYRFDQSEVISFLKRASKKRLKGR